MRRLANRLKKNDRGASAIEFAIIFPLLLLLVMGIIEFGWLLNGYITLTGGAREGARLAVIGKDYDEIKKAVEDHTVDLRLVEHSLNVNPIIDIPGEKTIVEVSGDMPLLIGFFFPGADSLNMSTKATMRQEIGN